METCSAIKKDGTPCSNKAKADSKCGVHATKNNTSTVSPASEVTCGAIKKDGTPCSNKAKDGGRCGVHEAKTITSASLTISACTRSSLQVKPSTDLLSKSFSPEELAKIRGLVEFGETITADWLHSTFNWYDLNMFNGTIKLILDSRKQTISFAVSKGIKRIGQYSRKNTSHEIKLSNKTIISALDGKTSVLANGIICRSIKELALCVFEHELCHFIHGILYPLDKSSHGPNFMKLASDLFGQTNFTHQLGQDAEVVIDNTSRSKSLIPGDRVRVKCEKKTIEGVVLRVNQKTITVKTEKEIWRIPFHFPVEKLHL
jgi:hypothetical protein